MTIIRGISLATWCFLMQATALHAQNLSHVGEGKFGVVRLFISGESWLERTAQILGIQDGAPARPTPDPVMHGEHAGHAVQHTGHRIEFWRVDSNARFRLSQEGLSEAPEMDAVLVERTLALSQDPRHEDVLILAHGPGDDAENERLIRYISERINALHENYNFNNIKVATLREDWPEKRDAAQKIVRDYVAAAHASGRTALVVPYRVYGFGPYAEVLDGLDYVADETGLVPHPAVAGWTALP